MSNNKDSLNTIDKKLDKILIKYIPGNNNNFDKFFSKSIDIYNKSNIEDNDCYFFYKLIDSSIDLDKKNYKIFIKYLKKYKIYRFYNKKFKKILFRLSPKHFINIHYIKSKYYLFLSNKYKLFNNKRVISILHIISNNNIFKSFKYIFTKSIYINYMELVITTKCSLKCKDCANLMYMYNNPYDVDINITKKALGKLFEAVDCINTFRILGGEPFCNINLKNYLKLLPNNKIYNIWIVTNGTIVPKDDELFDIMRNKNIKVEISDYKELSFNKDILIKKLEKERIEYEIKSINSYWLDYGKMKMNESNESELNIQFRKCNNECKSLLNGSLYYCPRSSHGYDLNILNHKSSERIDLINNTKKDNKKQIKQLLYRKTSIEACKYCNYKTNRCKKIIPAIQKRNNK